MIYKACCHRLNRRPAAVTEALHSCALTSLHRQPHAHYVHCDCSFSMTSELQHSACWASTEMLHSMTAHQQCDPQSTASPRQAAIAMCRCTASQRPLLLVRTAASKYVAHEPMTPGTALVSTASICALTSPEGMVTNVIKIDAQWLMKCPDSTRRSTYLAGRQQVLLASLT